MQTETIALRVLSGLMITAILTITGCDRQASVPKFDLPGLNLNAKAESNPAKVIFFNNSDVVTHGIDSRGAVTIKINGKDLVALPPHTYVRIFLEKNEYDLHLSHLDGSLFESDHKLKVDKDEMFVEVSPGATSNSYKIADRLPDNFITEYKRRSYLKVYAYTIDGLTVRTGDLICTTNGNRSVGPGQFWFLIGVILPGDVDHIVVYIGPGGRCVESGAKGRVIEFNVMNNTWNANEMVDQRGPLIDTFYGVAYPLAGRQLSDEEESDIRSSVAEFCLEHVKKKTPYNLNFTNSKTEDAIYCSQLAYLAYLKNGIDLNTEKGIPRIPGSESIILPEEIWNSCEHERP
jgi:hypothetical protein